MPLTVASCGAPDCAARVVYPRTRPSPSRCSCSWHWPRLLHPCGYPSNQRCRRESPACSWGVLGAGVALRPVFSGRSKRTCLAPRRRRAPGHVGPSLLAWRRAAGAVDAPVPVAGLRVGAPDMDFQYTWWPCEQASPRAPRRQAAALEELRLAAIAPTVNTLPTLLGLSAARLRSRRAGCHHSRGDHHQWIMLAGVVIDWRARCRPRALRRRRSNRHPSPRMLESITGRTPSSPTVLACASI